MKKIEFLATCPGCGAPDVKVKSKKPTYVVPNTAMASCHVCESRIQFHVSIPRNKTNSRQISFKAMKITVSPKLAEMVAAQTAEIPVPEAPTK